MKKTVLITVTSSFLSLATLGTPPSTAAGFDVEQIIVFGDSLSDNGNLFNFTNGAFPVEPFYSQGRLSNGPLWVEYLAEDFGLDLIPFTQPGGVDIANESVNFATAGATTGTENISPFPGIPSLSQQVSTFQALLNGQQTNEDSLYIFWAGSNDYFARLREPSAVVENLSNAIASVANAGASNILVTNLPNLGNIPLIQSNGPEAVSFFNQLTSQHNALLAEAIEDLSQTFPNQNFLTFDVNSLFEEIRANPSSFGFNNVTDNCTGINPLDPNTFILDNLNNCLNNNPNTFLFYDNQHPTTAGHEILGDRAEAILRTNVPENRTVIGLLIFSLYLFRKSWKSKIS